MIVQELNSLGGGLPCPSALILFIFSPLINKMAAVLNVVSFHLKETHLLHTDGCNVFLFTKGIFKLNI